MITVAEACDLIVAERGASVGAAQKLLRQAGASGEVRSNGVHLNKCIQLVRSDWQRSAINFETSTFDQCGGLLPGARFALIDDVTVDEGDLRAWLGAQREPQAAVQHRQKHKGGRPKTLAKHVEAWYAEKDEAYLQASDTALEASFLEENPGIPGATGSIRRIIGNCRHSRESKHPLA